MSGFGDLHAALVELQGVCLAALADTPGGAPSCSYISSGPPPWDVCPCLIVYTSGPAVADTSPLQPSLSPGQRTTRYGEVNVLSVTALVLRCTWEPEDASPHVIDGDGITAVAEQTNADLWAILHHVRAAKRAGTLWAPVEREFFVDPPFAVPQQGGAAGWQINFRTELDGYAPS